MASFDCGLFQGLLNVDDVKSKLTIEIKWNEHEEKDTLRIWDWLFLPNIEIL